LKLREIMDFNGQRQFTGSGSTKFVVSPTNSAFCPPASLGRETDEIGKVSYFLWFTKINVLRGFMVRSLRYSSIKATPAAAIHRLFSRRRRGNHPIAAQ
jgi:hypothetical protein